MQSGSAPLVVPELLCPVAPAISPYAGRLDLDVADWASANLLCSTPERQRRLTEARFGTLAARTCPDAGLERLTLYARWWAFGFSFSDEFFGERPGTPGEVDRRRTAADSAMATVSAFVPGGMPGGMPRLEHIRRLHRLDLLKELLTSTDRLARCDQFSRFGTALNLCLSRHVVSPPAPTGPGYVSPFLILGEIIGECPASGAELTGEDVARLTVLAGERTAWCELIHAAVRQDSYGELLASLPAQLRLGAEDHPQRALDRAARAHDEATRAYLRLERTLSDGASPGVRAYLGLLAAWSRGHHDWCRDILPESEPAPARPAEVRIVLAPVTPRAEKGAKAARGC